MSTLPRGIASLGCLRLLLSNCEFRVDEREFHSSSPLQVHLLYGKLPTTNPIPRSFPRKSSVDAIFCPLICLEPARVKWEAAKSRTDQIGDEYEDLFTPNELRVVGFMRGLPNRQARCIERTGGKDSRMH